MSFASSSNVGLYIHPRNGNVGIGTGVPLTALHVCANTTTSGVVIDQVGAGGILDIRDGGASKVVMDGNGNVGIGTGVPLTALHVRANTTTSGVVIDQLGAGGILDIRDGGVSQVVVDGSGNVGIGTGVPLNVLHVRANTTTSGVVIDQVGAGGILDVRDGGVSKVVVDGNGNVGIGTTNPHATLHVNENAIITGWIKGAIPFYSATLAYEGNPYSGLGSYTTGVNTNVPSWYNNTTKQFKPLLSGNYYVFASALTYSSGGAILSIRKNGSQIARGYSNGAASYITISQSIILSMNGTTDYIDINLTNMNVTDPSPNGVGLLNIYLIAS